MKIIKLAFLVQLVAISTTAAADSYSPSHSCYQPSKPYEFNDQWEVDRFNNEVEEYRDCISDFVEEQNDAIRRHQTAAEEAIDDWNNFVRWELN